MVIASIIICRISSIVGTGISLFRWAYMSAKQPMIDWSIDCSTPYRSRQGWFFSITFGSAFDTQSWLSILKKSCAGWGKKPHRFF